MANEELIPVTDFCTHHHIEVAFVQSLQEYGLVEVQTVHDAVYLQPDQLAAVEQLMHLHYDLDVNFEGLDVIHHMLQRLEGMRREMSGLKNRLRFYEEPA